MTNKLKLLFICTHNRCRSILAEAITNKIAGEQIVVKSAGSSAVSEIHPQTVIHLNRYGYNTDKLYSKSWSDVERFDPDICITVCDNAANETCPLWLGSATKIHWGLKDPSLSGPEVLDINAAFDVTIALIEKRMAFISAHHLTDMKKTEITQLFKQAGEL